METHDEKYSDERIFPGSYGLPFVGETIAWRRDPLKFLRRRNERYGRIFKSSIYGRPEITMLGPEANEFILSSHRANFEWGGGYELFLDRSLFRQNLFLQDGEFHGRHRQIILPAFHGRALKGYFDLIFDLTRSYVQRWAESGPIAVYVELRKLTFEIAARLLLGADSGAAVEQLSRWFDILARGTQAFPKWDLLWTKYGRARRAGESLRCYFQTILDRRRSNPKADALGMLVAATDDTGARLTDEEIVSQIMMIVLAAHDTTSSQVTWLLHELERHQEIAARLRSELEDATRGRSRDADVIAQLHYLDLVLKEVERLHPALTGLPRKVIKEFAFDGYRVPVGSIVYYSILFTHMMPDIFADPERFDPDRFAAPRSEDERTPYSLVGFGGGPRTCIGRGFARMEMKIIAATLLQDYEWSVVPGQNLRPIYSPTNRPKDGLKIIVTEREK